MLVARNTRGDWEFLLVGMRGIALPSRLKNADNSDRMQADSLWAIADAFGRVFPLVGNCRHLSYIRPSTGREWLGI